MELESICKKFMADNLKDVSNDPAFQTLQQSEIVNIVQIATAKMCIDG